MPTYTPDPTDPTRPTSADPASTAASEFQALKGYIQTLIASGPNGTFQGIGGFRNKLRNGRFGIAQRGATVVVNASNFGYTLDGWLVGATGAAVSGNAVSGGDLIANLPALQLKQAAGGTSSVLQQRIESYLCSQFTAGSYVTVSGYYKTSGGINTPTIRLDACTSAADTWTSSVISGSTVPLPVDASKTNVWQFFKWTFKLATDATAGLSLVFNMSSLLAGNGLYFALLQAESGQYASAFDYLPSSIDTILNQRYYQVGNIVAGGYQTAGNAFTVTSNTPTTMRAVPAVNVTASTPVNLTSLTTTASTTNPGDVFFVGQANATGPVSFNTFFTLGAEL